MKILIVNKFLYPNGGSETYIFKLGEELKKRGHEVWYFGMEHEGNIVGNDAGIYTSVMDFHSGGIKKLLYPFKIIYSREAYKKMYEIMQKFGPDIIHLNNINFQLTPSVIHAARNWEKRSGKKVKIIFTAHDYQWVCPNHMLMVPSSGELCFKCEGGKFGACTKNKCIHGSTLRSILGTMEAGHYLKKKTYGMVDVIICPSEFLKKKLETYPLFKENAGKKTGRRPAIVMMHNFKYDHEEPSANGQAKAENASGKGNYVLYFGRYSEEKGVKTLLKVTDALPGVSFKFAGNGPLKNMVEGRDNITEMGFLHGSELANTIKRAKLTVFPSEWYENCPFSVMESQIYQTPVLASDIGGVSELLKDGVTGELFKAGDYRDLKAHLEGMLEDPDKLERYTKNCADVHFDSVEEYTDRFLAL
ncbi:MAG: glycosyltransferase [Lachnospiraceae bacterium]|nr:glycosyltransferase [Lachnospiraceae bacterium]